MSNCKFNVDNGIEDLQQQQQHQHQSSTSQLSNITAQHVNSSQWRHNKVANAPGEQINTILLLG
uniref:Uncharacterized protein n=1 Tax=Glossina austeni TaxID=7395 RepID=A0A1A9UW17_GLOAU